MVRGLIAVGAFQHGSSLHDPVELRNKKLSAIIIDGDCLKSKSFHQQKY